MENKISFIIFCNFAINHFVRHGRKTNKGSKPKNMILNTFESLFDKSC